MTRTAARPDVRAAMYMPGLRPGSMSWTIYRAFRDAVRDAGVDFRIVSDGPASGDDDGPESLPTPRSGLVALVDRVAAPLTRNASFVRTCAGLRRWLRRQPDLDLLYVEIAYPLATAAALARRAAGWKGRLVATPMGEDFLVVEEASYGYRRHFLPDRLLRWTLGEADGVRCISPMVERWIAGAGLDTGPRLLLPLNVAPATVEVARLPAAELGRRRARAAAALRREVGVGDGPLIGSLGRLHPFKGIHVLVRAMTELPDAVLVIVGPSMDVRGYGDYGDHLRGIAEAAGIGERVHFVGRVDHGRVPEILAGIDALVVPSIQESLNRVCIEAAATGTPFVVTSTTGISDLLPETSIGQVVPPDDPGALAAGIATVLGDDWPYEDEAARRWARGFAAGEVGPRLADWLREIRAGAPGGAP